MSCFLAHVSFLVYQQLALSIRYKFLVGLLETWTRVFSVCHRGWRRSVVVSALASINVVNQHWARLVLGWVTACGRVNHLGM